MTPEAQKALQAIKAILENVSQYRAYNGDDWPARQANEALSSLPAIEAALKDGEYWKAAFDQLRKEHDSTLNPQLKPEGQRTKAEEWEACHAALFNQLNPVMEENNKLQRFKDYVHKRLDDAGIPTHPEGEHSQYGCRIGDRLDVALNRPKVSLGEAAANIKAEYEEIKGKPMLGSDAVELAKACAAAWRLEHN